MPAPPVRARNDPQQYDDLAHTWWDPAGPFAALHWLAAARGRLIPPPRRPGALLVDLACGAGLLAPYVPSGYRHVGVDLMPSALRQARAHGVTPVAADITTLPLRDGCADVVVAGEVLEHVADLAGAVSEAARILAAGGVVLLDTINATRRARLSLVTVGERLPGGPPPRVHDPDLFVAPGRLTELFARHGVGLRVRGLRPSLPGYARFLVSGRGAVRMLPTGSTAALYQGVGRKARI